MIAFTIATVIAIVISITIAIVIAVTVVIAIASLVAGSIAIVKVINCSCYWNFYRKCERLLLRWQM